MVKPKLKLSAALHILLTVLITASLIGCNNTAGQGSQTSGNAQSTEEKPLNEVTDMATSKITEAETTSTAGVSADVYTPLVYDDFKAMWLSQFDMASIYTSAGAQRSEESFTSYVKKILANIKNAGMNTVIVQVRPYADSMYPSDYYPMSSIAVGSYGALASYDPLAIIINEAHAIELSVQAWINPMRAMLDSEIGKVDSKYLIKQWYSDTAKNGLYIVKVSNRWYLNPAYEEVRQLIIDGVREILLKYDVDGLHMDDYFYPTGIDSSFDSKAYVSYIKSGGKATLADWRREQLNKLVAGLYSAVKENNEKLLFGISPAGNYTTVYDSMYADIYEWCGKTGYIDYICPQIYFGFNHATCDFIKVATKYQSMIKTDSVKLVIGMTLGKANSGYEGTGDQYAGATGKNEWINNRDILFRELEYTLKLEKCTGVAYFSYQYFHDPLTGAEDIGTADERSLFVPLLKTITWKN